MKEDLLKIIDYYGIIKQLKYVHTEYFELDEAIINSLDDEYIYYPEVERTHKEHIKEEIADVFVMLKQFQYAFNITDEDVKKVMKEKINRQLERIKNERENK